MLSVSKMRGCFAAAGVPALAIVAIALVVGLVLPGRCTPRGTGQNQGEYQLGDVLFTVNDIPVYEGEVRYARAQAAQNSRPSNDAMTELNKSVEQISFAVERAVILAMAKWQNVKGEEAEVVDFAQAKMNEGIDSMLKQSRDMHQLMITSSQSMLDTLKKSKGADSKEAKDAQANLDRLKAMTDDEIFSQATQGQSTLSGLRAEVEQRLALMKEQPMLQRLTLAELLNDRLTEKYKSEVEVSDSMVKESYDRVTFKEIAILKATHPDFEQRAAEAIKAIQGGMPFDQAIMKYSDRKPVDPTKKEQFSSTIERINLWLSPDTRAISDLKINKLSAPINTEVGISIVMVTKVELATPPSVDSVKKARIDQIKQVIGGSTYEAEKRKFSAEAKFEWKSEEAKLLYDYWKMTAGDEVRKLDGEANREKRIDAWRDVYTRAKQAESMDSTLSALLQYASFFQMYGEVLAGPEKEKLKVEQAELYRTIESEIPFPAFRMQFVEALLDVKDGEGALKELLSISEGLYDTGDLERQRIKDVERLLPQAANYAPKDTPLIAKIQTELDRWHKDDDAAKKLAEEERKQAEKAAAEAKKTETPKSDAKSAPKTDTKAKGG